MKPRPLDCTAGHVLLHHGQIHTLGFLPPLDQNSGESQAFQILELLRKRSCQGCSGLGLVGTPNCKPSPEAQNPTVQVGIWAVPTWGSTCYGRQARPALPSG